LNNCLRRRGNAYGSLCGRLLLNSANKPNALANRCADEPLLPTRVANNPSGGVDATAQSRFRNDPATPDRGEQIVLAHHPITVADQKDQEVEHLRLDRSQRRIAAELSPSGVENTVFKSIQHFPAHSDRNRPPRCASASLTRVASFENQHHLKEISTPPQSRADRPLVSSYAFRLTSGEGLKPSDTNGMRDAALHTFVRHLSSDLRNFDGSAATHCHKPTD